MTDICEERVFMSVPSKRMSYELLLGWQFFTRTFYESFQPQLAYQSNLVQFFSSVSLTTGCLSKNTYWLGKGETDIIQGCFIHLEGTGNGGSLISIQLHLILEERAHHSELETDQRKFLSFQFHPCMPEDSIPQSIVGYILFSG